MDRRPNGGGASRSSGAAPLPHYADVVALPTDIDPNLSIKKLIEMAEACFRQAEFSRELGRPVEALRDYVRASVIIVHKVEGHRDYPALSHDWQELGKRHKESMRKIMSQSDTYNKIKADIMADNRITGVMPTTGRSSASSGSNLSSRPTTPLSSQGRTVNTSQQHNGSALPPSVSADGRKPRPIVQPKPDSLHGNVIRSNHNRASSVSTHNNTAHDALAAQFANLKGPQSPSRQDPRIKTHPLKPLGPREMPLGTQKPDLTLQHPAPTFPKLPDAIYSPVRANMSGEAAKLPSSTSRGQFSRTGSSASIHSSPPPPQRPSNDYSTPTRQFPAGRGTNEPPPELPRGDLITVDMLFKLNQSRQVSILLIDARGRTEFDEGHIMAKYVICIDPTISLRGDQMSADQIADALTIHGQEKDLFDRRHTYDLVVLYDQRSKTFACPARSSEEKALESLQRALKDLSYGRELKQNPMLLEGGLDAWKDLMGPNALATSETMVSTATIHRSATYKKQRWAPSALKPDEVSLWKQVVKDAEDETAALSPHFSRTTEDFLRRYPTPGEMESMTSPTAAPRQMSSTAMVPSIADLGKTPQKPGASLVRRAHSDLADMEHRSSGPSQRPTEVSPADPSWKPTGLHNPGNWCYANSVLQALVASDFGREIGRGVQDADWKSVYRVPKKENEKIEQPQLTMQILSSLFHWMLVGNFQVMKAETLMAYSKSITKFSGEVFGNHEQHDSSEFLLFLLSNLQDETNVLRDRKNQPKMPSVDPSHLSSALTAYWRSYSEGSRSIVDKYWEFLEVTITTCRGCKRSSPYVTETNHLAVKVKEESSNRRTSLKEQLANTIKGEIIEGYDCEHCRPHKQTAVRKTYYARLPSHLIIHLDRVDMNLQKNSVPVTWDLNRVDMSSIVLPETYDDPNEEKPEEFKGPFEYECYAVVEHHGNVVNAGHYTSYIRDWRSNDRSMWWYCDDSRVNRVRMDETQTANVFSRPNDARVPVLAFFKRKGGSQGIK